MATVDLIGTVTSNKRELKRHGPAHTELAKKNINLRDHSMWDHYYNPSFGKWLPKQKVFMYHGKKYKSNNEYVKAIEAGDISIPEGKVIKDKTGKLVNKPKKGYIRNNILYESKAKADEVDAKKLDEETQQFFRNLPVENEVAVRLSDIKPKQSLAHRRFNTKIRSIDTVQRFLSTKVMNEVQQIFDTNGSIILKIMYQLTAIKPMKKNEDTRSAYTTWTEKMHVLSRADITNLRTDLGTQFANSVETLPTRGSGLTFQSLDEVNVYATRYTPPAGSSYIPLPEWLANKGCCVNVQNTDNKCFAWAILSALYPASKDAQRVSKYTDKLDTLNMDGITYPVYLKDVKKFEMQNTMAINIYGVEDRKACLIYSSKKPKNTDQVVNLLLHNDHYCWIKNFNRFMNNSKTHQMFHCESCSVGFYTKELLDKHVAHGGCTPQFVTMPAEGATVKFKNFRNELACPLVI